MQYNKQNIGRINGLTESGFVGAFTAMYRYATKLIEQGGIWSLMLLPVTAAVSAGLYWHKTMQPEFNDSLLKTRLNKLYYGSKVVASAVGVGLAIAGMVTLGFTVLIGAAYVSVARNLGKTIRSAWQGDVRKAGNNLSKSVVGALIAGGFTIMTFFPPIALVGATMVFIATAHAVLSTAPSMVAELAVKPNVTPLKEIQATDEKKTQATTQYMYRPSVVFETNNDLNVASFGEQRSRRNSF